MVTGPLAVFIGGALVIYEIWEAAKAKADLEQMLREEFLRYYMERFSVYNIWRSESDEDGSSPRMNFEDRISRDLNRWFELCRQEAKEQNAVAGVVLLSPPVLDYIAKATKDAESTEAEVRAYIDLVGRVFPIEMVSSEPTQELLDMVFFAPDREELRYLAHELGDLLLVEYRKHGKDVLDAANRLGTVIFVQIVRSGEQLNWFDVHKTFEQYPRDMNEYARRGLLLVMRAQVVRSSPVDSATLESISRNQALFQGIAPLLQHDTGKLYGLFASTSEMEVVRQAFQRDADIAKVLLTEWPLRTWNRYREGDRFEALFNVAEYRVNEREQEITDFAREIAERDWLTFRFVESGLCAVQLWDTYAGPSAGQRQRKEADSAIALFDKGYSCEDLLSSSSLGDVEFYHKMTAGFGQPIYHRVSPVLKLIYVAIFLVIGIPVLVFVIRRLQTASGPKRQADPERTEKTLQAHKDGQEKKDMIEATGTADLQKSGE